MKQRLTTLPLLLAILPMASLEAQQTDNMVFNPSFEEHRDCPVKVDAIGVMKDVDAWWQPTRGSSDYFHACGSRDCQVPRNKMGQQAAHSGEGYCGIYCSQETYREYLQTELREPLVEGKRYRVGFWVSLADKSPQAVSALGALLTRTRVEDSTWGILMDREARDYGDGMAQYIATHYEPQVQNNQDRLLNNTKEWVEVSGEFVAEGGERFLTIGNFASFNQSGVVATETAYAPLSGAYYYIDDVSLRCLDTLPAAPPERIAAPEEGTVVRLENLYFATGESEVLQQSYKELLRLKEMLEAHPEMRIELRGHTDGQGTVAYNQRLSEARAKAVADYLVRLGIERRRLGWKGYGKSQPVADNSTAEGRRQNRRVEYRVLP